MNSFTANPFGLITGKPVGFCKIPRDYHGSIGTCIRSVRFDAGSWAFRRRRDKRRSLRSDAAAGFHEFEQSLDFVLGQQVLR
ncbi:MAG: hypothetical protein JNM63_19390 [Spirochaetia bacterium]|nr:hypothetical protein [Spirochaetia bacterium]